MTLRDRILAAPDGFSIMALDPDYEKACPCFTLKGDGLYVSGHCWRTSQDYIGGGMCGHRFVGLHVWGGDKALAKHLARVMTEMDWYGTWPVVLEPGEAAGMPA